MPPLQPIPLQQCVFEYDSAPVSPVFANNLWLQSTDPTQQAYYTSPPADDGYLWERGDDYQESDCMNWSATEDSTSQSDPYSEFDLPQSLSSASYVGPATPAEPLPADTTPKALPRRDSSAPGKTSIDALMLAIAPSAAPAAQPSPTSGAATAAASKPKKHLCPYAPACTKSFSQRTHLQIHIRAHSGEKPFVCRFAQCGHCFSQLGNLKTHERRHTGERPFICEVAGCGRRFAQRGNLRSHTISVHGHGLARSTSHPAGAAAPPPPYDAPDHAPHDDSSARASPNPSTASDDAAAAAAAGAAPLTRPSYECRLDGCLSRATGVGKPFTQLGNLKAHQNKFHAGTLGALGEKFAALTAECGGEVDILEGSLSPEDRGLWVYFRGLYRNCNKGIKGRGKGRKVEVVV